MPFRVFAAGEVLTAANVNDYLAEQAVSTFAGTAARASAITAPTEGQFAYLSDSDSLTFYNGSAWVNAGSAIAGTALSSGTATSGQVLTANGSGAVTFSTPSSGLTLINTTTFSGVSSQSVNDVFNATYDNYVINFQATTSSATTSLSFRLRSGGSDLSTGVYDRSGVITYNNASTISALNQTGATSIGFPDINTTYPAYTQFTMYLFAPFASRTKVGSLLGAGVNGSSQYAGMQFNWAAADANSRTGFTLITASGTFAGTLRTYGVNQ